MNKAVLDLNEDAFENYQYLDLEQNWRNVTAIRMWLKFRKFDLSLPIMVTKDCKANTLTFFQASSNLNKTIILVHPNPTTLQQLYSNLRGAGHTVHAYQKVKEANEHITILAGNKMKLDKIIVPKNLKVFHSCTYKSFLNKAFPNYKVLTVDDKNYRDNIDLKTFKKECQNG